MVERRMSFFLLSFGSFRALKRELFLYTSISTPAAMAFMFDGGKGGGGGNVKMLTF